MADMTRGMQVHNRLDERYSQRMDEVAAERKARKASDLRQADATGRERQVREARQQEQSRSARSLDAEQRQRNQQLTIDLSRAERERQESMDKARQSDTAVRPGSIYDLVV